MSDADGGGDGLGPRRGRLPRWFDGTVAALHAAFGDVIDAKATGLATPFALFEDQRPLATTRESLARARPHATGRVCLLVHGLGCTEDVWRFPPGAGELAGESYGTLLERDLGFTSYAVRYNTGLPVGRNGASLATLLDALLAAHPVPVRELVLVCHSMGGLVAGSACLAGAGSRWLTVLRHVITLGTPHEGAPLEQAVHVASEVLGLFGSTATRVIRDVAGARSEGIRDLRFGRVRAEAPDDGPDADVPWPPHVQLHRLAGLLAHDARHPLGAIFGDGMVQPRSARAARRGAGLPGEVALVPGISHLALCYDARVYERIRGWCEQAPDGRRDAPGEGPA